MELLDPPSLARALRNVQEARLAKGRRNRPPPRLGYACCPACSVARWRLLCAARPAGWAEVLVAGLEELATKPLVDSRAWARFPFFYTLLALTEMPPELTAPDRRRVRRAAAVAHARLAGDDSLARSRRPGVEWALPG